MRRLFVPLGVPLIVLSISACASPVQDRSELAFILDGESMRPVDPSTLVIAAGSIQEEAEDPATGETVGRDIDGEILLIRVSESKEGGQAPTRLLTYDLRDNRNRVIGSARIMDADGDPGFERIRVIGDLSRIPGLEDLTASMDSIDHFAETESIRVKETGKRSVVDAATGEAVDGVGH